MTVQAYVDETGLDGRGPWLLFSALLGTAEDWAGVSEGWRAALDESPRIEYFKMSEAAGFTGQFYGMSLAHRDYKLTRLARSLQGQYGFVEQTLTTHLPGVKAELKARSLKPADDPYFWSFHHLINAIGMSLLQVNYDEPFEIVFDDNPVWSPRARAWWPVIRALQAPRLKAILPVDPLLRDDRSTPPLQAADLTAWMSRQDKLGTNKFEWLREHLTGVHKSPHCADFGATEVALMFDERPITPEMQRRVDAAREVVEEAFLRGGKRHYVPKPKNSRRPRRS